MSVLKCSDPSLLQAPRASRTDRGSSRPRPRRAAANAASPRKGLSTRSISTDVGPMPAPPAFAARGRARCGSSPSSSAAPGSSPHGRLSTDVVDPSGVDQDPC